MTQSNCAFNHRIQGLLQLDPPQINAERLSMGLSTKTTNLRREQEQCQEGTGTSRQRDRDRKRRVLSSVSEPSWGMSWERDHRGSSDSPPLTIWEAVFYFSYSPRFPTHFGRTIHLHPCKEYWKNLHGRNLVTLYI